MISVNEIINDDCIKILDKLSENSIDLVITSPPYDNLRSYKGYNAEFAMPDKLIEESLQSDSVLCYW